MHLPREETRGRTVGVNGLSICENLVEQPARGLFDVIALECGYALVLRRVGEVVSSVERRSRCRVTRVELEDL